MTDNEQKLPAVLLVDDDPVILEMYDLEFSQRGFAVRTALSVDEATRLIEESKPDIVFTDLAMPGRDGFWLLEYLRTHANKDIAKLPVAVLTNRDDLEARTECERLGYPNFFVKVKNIPSQLVEKAQEIMSQPGLSLA